MTKDTPANRQSITAIETMEPMQKNNLKQQNEVNLRECKLNGRYVVVHSRQQVPMVVLLQESRRIWHSLS